MQCIQRIGAHAAPTQAHAAQAANASNVASPHAAPAGWDQVGAGNVRDLQRVGYVASAAITPRSEFGSNAKILPVMLWCRRS